ncbi:hypothetical protein ACGFIV_32905 [Sphaerisporangium sp. NPDC049003]|uniref:hypothetical protein n=1 Tax=Sphaerisporangium sp. NPDC049003 TaxID=3364517 RepID=UPI00371E834D
MRATGYGEESLTWKLTNPILTMKLGSTTAGTTVNSVDWKVVHQPSGTTVATPKGIEAKVALPVPPPSQVVTYDLYCTVDLTGLDGKHHTVSITYPNAGVAHVGWSGKALLAAFLITEDRNVDPVTGTVTLTDNLIFQGAG